MEGFADAYEDIASLGPESDDGQAQASDASVVAGQGGTPPDQPTLPQEPERDAAPTLRSLEERFDSFQNQVLQFMQVVTAQQGGASRGDVVRTPPPLPLRTPSERNLHGNGSPEQQASGDPHESSDSNGSIRRQPTMENAFRTRQGIYPDHAAAIPLELRAVQNEVTWEDIQTFGNALDERGHSRTFKLVVAGARADFARLSASASTDKADALVKAGAQALAQENGDKLVELALQAVLTHLGGHANGTQLSTIALLLLSPADAYWRAIHKRLPAFNSGVCVAHAHETVDSLSPHQLVLTCLRRHLHTGETDVGDDSDRTLANAVHAVRACGKLVKRPEHASTGGKVDASWDATEAIACCVQSAVVNEVVFQYVSDVIGASDHALADHLSSRMLTVSHSGDTSKAGGVQVSYCGYEPGPLERACGFTHKGVGAVRALLGILPTHVQLDGRKVHRFSVPPYFPPTHLNGMSGQDLVSLHDVMLARIRNEGITEYLYPTSVFTYAFVHSVIYAAKEPGATARQRDGELQRLLPDQYKLIMDTGSADFHNPEKWRHLFDTNVVMQLFKSAASQEGFATFAPHSTQFDLSKPEFDLDMAFPPTGPRQSPDATKQTRASKSKASAFMAEGGTLEPDVTARNWSKLTMTEFYHRRARVTPSAAQAATGYLKQLQGPVKQFLFTVNWQGTQYQVLKGWIPTDQWRTMSQDKHKVHVLRASNVVRCFLENQEGGSSVLPPRPRRPETAGDAAPRTHREQRGRSPGPKAGRGGRGGGGMRPRGASTRRHKHKSKSPGRTDVVSRQVALPDAAETVQMLQGLQASVNTMSSVMNSAIAAFTPNAGTPSQVPVTDTANVVQTVAQGNEQQRPVVREHDEATYFQSADSRSRGDFVSVQLEDDSAWFLDRGTTGGSSDHQVQDVGGGDGQPQYVFAPGCSIFPSMPVLCVDTANSEDVQPRLAPVRGSHRWPANKRRCKKRNQQSKSFPRCLSLNPDRHTCNGGGSRTDTVSESTSKAGNCVMQQLSSAVSQAASQLHHALPIRRRAGAGLRLRLAKQAYERHQGVVHHVGKHASLKIRARMNVAFKRHKCSIRQGVRRRSSSHSAVACFQSMFTLMVLLLVSVTSAALSMTIGACAYGQCLLRRTATVACGVNSRSIRWGYSRLSALWTMPWTFLFAVHDVVSSWIAAQSLRACMRMLALVALSVTVTGAAPQVGLSLLAAYVMSFSFDAHKRGVASLAPSSAFGSDLGVALPPNNPFEHVASPQFPTLLEPETAFPRGQRKSRKRRVRRRLKAQLRRTCDLANQMDILAFNVVEQAVLDERVHTCLSDSPSTQDFILDSGASVHVVNFTDWFDHMQPARRCVRGAGGLVESKFTGSLSVNMMGAKGGAEIPFHMPGALYMPQCPSNLLSVGRLRESGIYVQLDHEPCVRFPDGGKVPITVRGNLFIVTLSQQRTAAEAHFVCERCIHDDADDDDENAVMITHDQLRARLGFLSKQRVRHLIRTKRTRGITIRDREKEISFSGEGDSISHSAVSAKQPTPSRRANPSSAPYPFHTVMTDVVMCQQTGLRGERYAVNFIDELTGFNMAYCMHTKDQVPQMFETFLRELSVLRKTHGYRTQSKFEVARLKSDNGGEYTSDEFQALLARHSIAHVTTAPNTPQENGAAERINGTLFRMCNTMLQASLLSPAFWPFAYGYANFIRNRIPLAARGGRSPYELVFGTLPLLGNVRVFGADAYVHQHSSAKLGVKAKHGIFVGMDPQGRWRILDPVTRDVTSEKHAAIVEDFEYRRRRLLQYDEELLDDEKNLSLPYHHFGQKFDTQVRGVACRRLFTPGDALRRQVHPGGAGSLLYRSPDVTAGELPDPAKVRPTDVVPDDPQPLDMEEAQDDSLRTNGEPTAGVGSSPRYFGIESGPLSDASLHRAAQRRHVERQPGAAVVRPLRLAGIGKKQAMSEADHLFLKAAKHNDFPVRYLQNNPKSKGSAKRYEVYKHATTLSEARKFGATAADIEWDYQRGFIWFPGRESSEVAGVIGSDIDHAVDFCETCSPWETDNPWKHQVFNAAYSYHEFLKQLRFDTPRVDFLSSQAATQSFAQHSFESMLLASTLPDGSSVPLDPDEHVPTTIKQVYASKHKERWLDSIRSEFKGLVDTGTVGNWIPISEAEKNPDFSKPLHTRYLFKVKFKDGVPYKYKARLVVRGDMAIPGLHYDQVFAPTSSYDSVRILLSLAAAERMDIYQADISQAFLQADVQKPVYIYKPHVPGEPKDPSTQLVCKLNKSLYGIPSAPRSWWMTYRNYLVDELGFTQLTSDACVFVKDVDGEKIYTSVFVDDVLVCTRSVKLRQQFMQQLKTRFPINELETGTASWLLGMKITKDRDSGTVTLSQRQAILKLAEACGVDRDKQYHSPIPMQPKLLRASNVKEFDASPHLNGMTYRSVVGSILYLAMCTRPDVATAVGILARHANTHDIDHVEALKRVVGYLYSTADLGISYHPQAETQANRPQVVQRAHHPQRLERGNRPISYCDADYAGSVDYRSTTGFVVFLNGGPVVWASRIQKLTAQSTAEAEVIAATDCVKEVVHLRLLLSELGFSHVCDEPTPVMEDNAACTAFANDLKNRRAAKHYAIRLRFLQEQVNSHSVKFIQTPSARQIGDILTKPIAAHQFRALRDQLMGQAPIALPA